MSQLMVFQEHQWRQKYQPLPQKNSPRNSFIFLPLTAWIFNYFIFICYFVVVTLIFHVNFPQPFCRKPAERNLLQHKFAFFLPFGLTVKSAQQWDFQGISWSIFHDILIATCTYFTPPPLDPSIFFKSALSVVLFTF